MKETTFGGVRLSMRVEVTTVEMSGWAADRIRRFFDGVELIQAATNDVVTEREKAYATSYHCMVRQLNGLPPFRDEPPTYKQRVAAWLDSIPIDTTEPALREKGE